MKATPALVLIALGGCATGAPPVDNPSAPPPARTDVTRENEVRALDQAEAECVAHGQHAEAKRVDGTTLYECVAPADAAPAH